MRIEEFFSLIIFIGLCPCFTKIKSMREPDSQMTMSKSKSMAMTMTKSRSIRNCFADD